MGNDTALPAIAHRVEELPAGANVTTVVVVNDAAEAQVIHTQAHLNAYWIYRSSESDDDAASLLRVLGDLVLPEGDGFVWIAAEAEVARALRQQMLDVRRHPPAWLKASGYWVRAHDGAHASF